MLSTSFDYTVTSTRVVNFTVPATVLPGSNCQFNITITHDGAILGILWFVKVVPANRVITFTVGPNIPLGTHHFTVLITILSSAGLTAASTASPGAAKSADEFTADQPARALDAASQEQSNRTGTMPASDDVAAHST
jgi:hypothetical protein